MFLIAGRMQSRKYEDKEGINREAWDIVAREMLMLGGKVDDLSSDPRTYKAGDPIPYSQAIDEKSQASAVHEKDDLPF
jgi:single-strand DNA-binding protein